MIGILPVRDAAEVKPVGPTISQGDKLIRNFSLKQPRKKKGGETYSDIHFCPFSLVSVGFDSLDQSSKLQGGSSDSHKLDTKNQNDAVHWHSRYSSTEYLLYHLKNIGTTYLIAYTFRPSA